MTYTRFAFGILLFASLAAGCSTPAVITPTDAPGIVLQKVRARNTGIRTLLASGKISIDSPDFSGPANIELRLSKPDSALMKISGPFGISIGSGLFTSRQFTFYDGYHNTVITGETNPQNLSRAFRMSVTFNDIIDILSGSFGISSALSGSIPKGGFNDGTYNLLFNTPDGTEEYRINTDYAAVSRFLEKDKEDNIVQDITFRDFRKVNGVYMPHIITLQRPQQEESISIVYDRERVNEMPVDFTFSVPNGAKRVEL